MIQGSPDSIEDVKSQILPPSGQFGLLMLDAPETDTRPTGIIQWEAAKHGSLKNEPSPEDIQHLKRIIEEGAIILRDMVTRSEPVPSYLVWSMGQLCVALFEYLRRPEELEMAIECFTKLLALVPKDYVGRTDLQRSLAGSFEKRFEISRQLEDLDKAVKFYKLAFSTAITSTQKVKALFAAGRVLSHRSFLTRSRNDLDHGITLLEDAVSLGRNLEGIQRIGTLMTTLGIRLRDRYYMSRSKSDIQKAFSMCQQAENTIPPGKFHRMILRNLARTHLTMYSAIHKRDHLEAAFQLFKHILDNTPQEHDDWPQAILDISTSLWYLYSATNPKNLKYLDLAIGWAQILMKDDPQNNDVRYTLGHMLATRSTQRGGMEGRRDNESAVAVLRSVIYCQDADSEMRLASGRMLSRILYENASYQEAWETIKEMLCHSPVASPPSIDYNDKQWLYSEHYASGLASEAAAIALTATNDALDALDALERGSRQLLTSFNTLYADITELQKLFPDLSSSLLRLQSELRHGATPPGRRSQASRELEVICSKIREKPGFEDFLLPPTEQQLHDAAIHGPIVILNSHYDRSDAILIQGHQVRSLRLPYLRREDVIQKTSDGDFASIDTLEWLWRSVCEPVLSALDLNDGPADGEWPHLWWIPVGELSRFPFHAAGIHHVGQNTAVLDRVMSSYALLPSVILGNRKLETSVQLISQKQVLLVAMPFTPNRPSLYNAQIEIDAVGNICKVAGCNVTADKRGKMEVLEALAASHIFHFAGHGTTHATDPSQSALLLQDWQSDSLCVGDLLKQELRAQAPFLAYLSACGTGRIQDGRDLDESIHLMSSLQLAGFRHVIGTLWSVDDKSCAEIAEISYQTMFDRGLTDKSVCEGLHEATRILRQKWLLTTTPPTRGDGVQWDMFGTTQVTTVGPQLNWAAYLHFGC